MHILSILGMAGLDKEEKPAPRRYVNTTELKLADGYYLNSTDALLSHRLGTFSLLGTKEAIALQSKILTYDDCTVEWIEFEKDNLADLFGKILKIIDSDEPILVDVTHGLRHQPIMATFSAFIGTLLKNRPIRLLFAAEASQEGEVYYRYIYLDDYMDYASSAFGLSTFLKSLAAPEPNAHDTIAEAMHRFSRELFSNHLSALFREALPHLSAKLQEQTPLHTVLRPLIDDLLELLDRFYEAKNRPALFMTYLDLCAIMLHYNYPLIATTYLFEGIQLYMYHHFKRLGIVEGEPDYDRLSAIKNYVDKGIKNSLLKLPHIAFHCSNRPLFQAVTKQFESIRKIRNNTAHVNMEYVHQDLVGQLHDILDSSHDLFIKQDLFIALTVKPDPQCIQQTKLLLSATVEPKTMQRFLEQSVAFFYQELSVSLNTKQLSKHQEQVRFLQEQNFERFPISKMHRTALAQKLNNPQFRAILSYLLELNPSAPDLSKLQSLIKAFQKGV